MKHKNLLKCGIEEIIIIAQDTTKYGTDIYKKPKIVELINEISKIEKIRWIRFLYAYPESITDELITEVKNNPKICKYFDIPIQHIENDILKKMNRKSTKESIIQLIQKIKEEIMTEFNEKIQEFHVVSNNTVNSFSDFQNEFNSISIKLLSID